MYFNILLILYTLIRYLNNNISLLNYPDLSFNLIASISKLCLYYSIIRSWLFINKYSFYILFKDVIYSYLLLVSNKFFSSWARILLSIKSSARVYAIFFRLTIDTISTKRDPYLFLCFLRCW